MNNNYIKSPLNYVGSKYKLLPQIIPFFPDNTNTFIDLFSGGSNVGANIKANKIICNDIITPLIEFCNACKKLSSENMINTLDDISNTYELSKTNKDGYLQLREDYNSGNKDWSMFYSLVAHSFSNQIRFNSKGEFNLPFGDRYFNPKLRQNFIRYVGHLKTINIEFTNQDYSSVIYNADLTTDDFAYIDPPYLASVATYNEQGGWTPSKERELLSALDYLNENGIRFALSNVLEHKGKTNDIVAKWSQKYKVHDVDSTYANCNYQTKDRRKDSTKEVLIVNY